MNIKCSPTDIVRRRRSMRGAVTAMEAAIAFICILGGLLFMAPYFQRAMQGNIFGSAQAMGQPFDPRDLFTETQQVDYITDTVKHQVVWGMFSAALQPATEIDPFMWDFYRSFHPDLVPEQRDWILESLPSGPVFREPAAQESASDASWKVNRTATSNDDR